MNPSLFSQLQRKRPLAPLVVARHMAQRLVQQTAKPFFLALCGLATSLPQLSHAQDYQQLEDIQFSVFTDTGGIETHALTDFEGKIVVLYYFSPW